MRGPSACMCGGTMQHLTQWWVCMRPQVGHWPLDRGVAKRCEHAQCGQRGNGAVWTTLSVWALLARGLAVLCAERIRTALVMLGGAFWAVRPTRASDACELIRAPGAWGVGAGRARERHQRRADAASATRAKRMKNGSVRRLAEDRRTTAAGFTDARHRPDREQDREQHRGQHHGQHRGQDRATITDGATGGML